MKVYLYTANGLQRNRCNEIGSKIIQDMKIKIL
jgi:hypothetical protein